MAKGASIFFQRGWIDVAGLRPGRGSLDGAYLMFLIEELIAQSALEVVIPTQSIPGAVADRMPDPIKKYIRTVDRLPARQRCFSVLAPVANELGFELDGEDRRVRRSTDQDLVDVAIELFDGFELFLSGIEHKSAIDLDVVALRRATSVVRGKLSGSEGREVLARLEGVLNTYQPSSIPTLRNVSLATPEQAKGFLRLLEDREYAELSGNTLDLGIPARFGRAVQIMRRIMEDIVSRPPFKQLFNLGTRTITAATHGVPIPDSDAIQALLSSEYLPPAIPLADAMSEAAKRWKRSAIEFIPFPGWESVGRAR
jgi:hypothetical protein